MTGFTNSVMKLIIEVETLVWNFKLECVCLCVRVCVCDMFVNSVCVTTC